MTSYEPTQWLRSPVTEKQFRLRVHKDVFLEPYYGKKKKIHLRYTSYRIGSGTDMDIRIDDPYISKEHAVMALGDDGCYRIEDCGSKNGVFLNGTRIQKAKLPSKGILRLGRSTLRWREVEEAISVQEGNLLIADPGMIEAVEKLKPIAKSGLPILLLGETGSGKEVLARLIHEWSERRAGPFEALNGALAAGGLVDSELFGHKKGAYTGAQGHRQGALLQAHHGTFFLDELGDVPLATQVKLLRVLESGEVKPLGADRTEKTDFRLVSATSLDLEQKIESGEFRMDLYYRIAGYVFRIPPLRERPKDLLLIAHTLCAKKEIQLGPNAEAKLLSHPWPGNIRELKSTLYRAILLCRDEASSELDSRHIEFSSTPLSVQLSESECKGKSLNDLERLFILRSLERNAWSRNAVAKELGIARSTLFEKMRKYGLKDRA